MALFLPAFECFIAERERPVAVIRLIEVYFMFIDSAEERNNLERRARRIQSLYGSIKKRQGLVDKVFAEL